MGKKKFGYGDFFCWNCGDRMKNKAKKCPVCGVLYSGKDKYGDQPLEGAGGLGWSDKTRHPSFKKYAKNHVKAGLVWLVGLSILVPGGLLISKEISFDSEGKYVIAGVISIFWAFGIGFFLLTYRKKRDWEGLIEAKKIVERQRKKKGSDGRAYYESYRDYILVIRMEDGGLNEVKWTNSSDQYDYFREGDVIRYHGGRYLDYIEKYDKRMDPILYCVSCGDGRDSRDNFCGRCGSILLKGK